MKKGGGKGDGVSSLSAGAYTATLYVMVTIKKGVGEHPPHSPARADIDFSIMMECTPEIGHCHSVCILWLLHVTSLYTVPDLKSPSETFSIFGGCLWRSLFGVWRN
jgi:hypothetical protein